MFNKIKKIDLIFLPKMGQYVLSLKGGHSDALSTACGASFSTDEVMPIQPRLVFFINDIKQ